MISVGIDVSKGKSTIGSLCKIAEIHRSSYYKWLIRKEGKNEQFNKEIMPINKAVYEEKNGLQM